LQKWISYSLNYRFSSDINECEATPEVCTENTECENTVGSYKCTSRIHHVVTKILREEDYNENEDDDDEDEDKNDNDYGEITEVPQSPKCEDGFKKNENLECIGKCTQ